MEVIATPTDLINKFKSLSSENFLEDIIQIISTFDVYFNYEKNKNNKIIRIILLIKKNNNNHPPIYYHCNGCVIDTIKWKIISMPPITFNKKQFPILIESYFKQGLYDIYKVIDGTVVTIYYWNNAWNISSSHGYDVSSFYWMGTMTYSEIIYDLFTRLYPNTIEHNGIELIDNYSLNFNKLKKNKCYTIGFRHHNYHPLLLDPEYIWNIQNVNLDTNEVEYNDGIIGLPNQQIITAIDSLDQLQYLNKTSIQDAIRSENPTFNYGYILRSKDIKITKEFSNILLPSMLLKKIKKNIYEYPSNVLRQYITNLNRFDYISLKNFFNKSEKNEIIQLYPQMNKKYTVYTQCMTDVIKCTILIMKSKKTNIDEPLHFQPCIISLANSLIKHISKFEALDPFHADTESILKDYYSNIEYSVLFLNAINKYK